MREDNIDFTCDTEDCIYWTDGVCKFPASITIQDQRCLEYEKSEPPMSVIEFAEKRLSEESCLPDGGESRYWAAYLDGARAQEAERKARYATDGKKNVDIRKAAITAGVRLWEISDAIGINASNFSRKLRKELPRKEKEKILGIIEKIRKNENRD